MTRPACFSELLCGLPYSCCGKVPNTVWGLFQTSFLQGPCCPLALHRPALGCWMLSAQACEQPRRRAGHEGWLAPLGGPAWLLFLLRTCRGSTRGFVGHAGNAGNGALLPCLVSDEVICKPRQGRAACSLYSLPVKAWKSWKEFQLALEALLLSELCPAMAMLKGCRKRARVLAFPL